MSDVRAYLWLIPALPLLAAALIMLFGRVLGKRSHWPCLLALAGAAACAFLTFAAVNGEGREVHTYYQWIKVGVPGTPHSLDIGVTLRADPLSAVMLVMITFIGTLIAIYSVGYMHGDPGYPRFFACIALFIFAMTTLVLADNFVLLYLGWEGVGLCSYLLIGFWFTRPAAADAARKAFLVTRIGDVGLFLGILLIWVSFDYRLDYGHVLRDFVEGAYSVHPGVLALICLLLFCGAMGKSAQFPLHVWLPDAMEGPTPVSALIHAATMVTAGVYLVARCTPLFMAAPEVQLFVAAIGGVTAISAAFMALTQNDLKRVLAYSTLSQLGYMFMALGSATGAGKGVVTFAVVAAMFHLFTHAFFKALLFLGAGSVMHAMGGVIDMTRFGGLRKPMPVTHLTFLCGALALAGFPLLSGFWSKDEILAALWEARHVTSGYGPVYLTLFGVGLLTAAMTAFYTFRAYFLTFHGELRVPPEAGSHGHDDAHAEPAHHHEHGHEGQAHESPAVMTVPLMILAVFALFVGVALGPTHLFAKYVEHAPGFPEAAEHHFHWPLMLTSAAVALAGIGLAWLMYVRKPEMPGRIARAIPGLYQLSLNKLHIDELYSAFIVRPLEGVARLARAVDRFIDEVVDLIGQLPRIAGDRLLRPMQNGLVQFYALAMALALTVFLIALVRAL